MSDYFWPGGGWCRTSRTLCIKRKWNREKLKSHSGSVKSNSLIISYVDVKHKGKKNTSTYLCVNNIVKNKQKKNALKTEKHAGEGIVSSAVRPVSWSTESAWTFSVQQCDVAADWLSPDAPTSQLLFVFFVRFFSFFLNFFSSVRFWHLSH